MLRDPDSVEDDVFGDAGELGKARIGEALALQAREAGAILRQPFLAHPVAKR